MKLATITLTAAFATRVLSNAQAWWLRALLPLAAVVVNAAGRL